MFLLQRDPATFAFNKARDGTFVWDFDAACNWNTSFRVLTPITNEAFAADLLERLELAELVIDHEQLALFPFMSCTCGDFLHYAWCKHSCAYSSVKKVITRWPPNKDPTRLMSKKRGRPARARRGGAFGKE